MTDVAHEPELEDDPRPALLERRRRLATRAAAIAVPVLLLASVVAAVTHDDPDTGTRVASTGTPAPTVEDGDEVIVEAPAVTEPVSGTPVKAPSVTAPRVRVPKVTVPTLPVTAPPLPVSCPTTPPSYEPPPQLGTYEISTGGGVGRMVAPWTEHTYNQDHTFSPDGSKIAFVRGWTDNDGQTPPKMYIADSDFTDERQVAADTRLPSGLTWSPDGRFIAFQAQPYDSTYKATYTLDVASGATRKISETEVNGLIFPRWSRDSTRLAFGGGWDHTPSRGLWVAEIGATPRVTKIADDHVSAVDWSPDSRQLVFATLGPAPAGSPTPPVSAGTFRIDRDGANRKQLRPDGVFVTWSPTTRSHLVVWDKGMMFRLDPDTGVFSFLAGGGLIGWLPDGSRLIAGIRGGYALLGWDGCAQPIVHGNAVAVQAATPDSKKLLFFRTQPYPQQ